MLVWLCVYILYIVSFTLCIYIYMYYKLAVPLLSRLLPSDVCRIYKTGNCIRYSPAAPLCIHVHVYILCRQMHTENVEIVYLSQNVLCIRVYTCSVHVDGNKKINVVCVYVYLRSIVVYMCYAKFS